MLIDLVSSGAKAGRHETALDIARRLGARYSLTGFNSHGSERVHFSCVAAVLPPGAACRSADFCCGVATVKAKLRTVVFFVVVSGGSNCVGALLHKAWRAGFGLVGTTGFIGQAQ
ncbi:MAG TPA: hypothetical protein VEN30_15220 [Paraburkholderia sp.]|nr:hypothetical protein [Paraburkholderia sp.]